MGSRGGFGSAGFLGRPGGSAILSPVGNRMGLASISVTNSGSTGGGTATQVQRQRNFTVATTIPAGTLCRVRYTNQYANGSGIQNGLAVMTLRAGFRLSSTKFAAVMFSGVRDAVLQPGDTVEGFWTPPIDLVPGTTYKEQAFCTFASVPSAWAGTAEQSQAFDEYQEWGTALTDRTATNWNSGTRTTNYTICPPIDICVPFKTNLPAVMIAGDSISSDGSNDSTFAGFFGYVQRALAANYAWTNVGATGQTMGAMFGSQAATRIQRFAKRGFTHMLSPTGTNDLAGAVPYSQLVTQITSGKAVCDAVGIKLIPFTLPPRTDPTNTTKNGSDNTNVWTWRQQYNTYIRSNNGVGYGYFDAAASFQDPVTTDLWRTDLGTPTTEGIHPLTVLHTQAMTDLAAALPSLLV